MTHYLVPAPVVGDLCFLSICLNIINEDTNSSQGEALWSISDPETASDFIREVKGRCFLLKLPDSLTGWRSPGQSVWARVHAHHFTRGQSDHPQERRRLVLYRRWWTHTHSHTHSSLPDTPPLHPHPPPQGWLTPRLTPWSLFFLPVDTAAESKPRTTGSLNDQTLSQVPAAVAVVCRVHKASQTQAPPPSPPPSAREKVSFMTDSICNLAV